MSSSPLLGATFGLISVEVKKKKKELIDSTSLVINLGILINVGIYRDVNKILSHVSYTIAITGQGTRFVMCEIRMLTCCLDVSLLHERCLLAAS